jgi:hypothetical protein
MLRGNRELWLALFAMILITGLYGVVLLFTRKVPPASELFGHSIGIVGFILMLMTETLYSLRKRSRSVRWGKCPPGCNSTFLQVSWVRIWFCSTPPGNLMASPELRPYLQSSS